MYYVYLTTNLLNGKQYCGQRLKYKDLSTTKRYFGSGKLLGRAIKKYGKENFTKVILQDDIPFDLIDDYEKYYIDYFNTKVPFGYNLTEGGKSGYRLSDETINRLKEINSGENNPMYGTAGGFNGRHHTEDSKNLMSTKHIGELNPFYGKHHTDETRKRISETQKRKIAERKH